MNRIPDDSARLAASSILQNYLDAGVDEIIGDEPVNWFSFVQDADSPRLESERAVTDPLTNRSVPNAIPSRAGSKIDHTSTFPKQTEQISRQKPIAPLEANLIARESAQACQSLKELEIAIRNFDGCALKTTAKSTCISRGNPEAEIMLIGEAPGRDEDIQGSPFVGRAGQLLDQMLAAINLSEKNAFITNIVYWRPPGNRTPSVQEAQSCLPFTLRQIELVAPQILVFLGGAAAKLMLNSNQGIMRLRGKWQNFEAGKHKCQAIATLHPAYLLRTPAAKRLAWRDLLMIKELLN